MALCCSLTVGYVVFFTLVSFFLVLLGVKFLLRYAIGVLRAGAREHIEALHIAKKDTPTMGGAVIGFTVAIAMVGALYMFQDMRVFSLLILWITFLVTGLWDDACKIRYARGISIVKKWVALCLGTAVSLAAWYWVAPDAYPVGVWYGMGGLFVGAIGYSVWAAIVILSTANCVNFADGLDGLAASLVSLYMLFFGLCAFISGDSVLGFLCLILFGATLGFLWHNIYPAAIFMGDVGSLSLGGVLALLVLMMRLELLILVACCILVLEGLSVIIQIVGWRFFKRRIFYLAPLHHHFEKMGIPETQVVGRFILISIIASTLAGLSFWYMFCIPV